MALFASRNGHKRERVPELLKSEVLMRSAGGQSTRQISTWLAERGIRLTHAGVDAYLGRHRAELMTLLTEELRAKLKTQVLPGLDELQLLRERAKRYELRAVERRDWEAVRAFVAEQRLCIDTVLRYCRLDAPPVAGGQPQVTILLPAPAQRAAPAEAGLVEVDVTPAVTAP